MAVLEKHISNTSACLHIVYTLFLAVYKREHGTQTSG